MSFSTGIYITAAIVLAAALSLVGVRIVTRVTPQDNAQYLPLVVGYLNGKIGAVAADNPTSKEDCLANIADDEKSLLEQAPAGASAAGTCVKLPGPAITTTAPSTLPPQSRDSAGESKTL
jgi:hypothetical protein